MTAITQMPPPRSTESPVKAVSPAARGRSAAESLDGIEASQKIGDVMVANGEQSNRRGEAGSWQGTRAGVWRSA